MDTVKEDIWGAVEAEVMGDDNAGEGSLGINEVMPASEVLSGLKGSLEGVFEEGFRGTDGTAKEGFTDTDPEHLGDGG